jgi:t-SNARE syntaxin family protein
VVAIPFFRFRRKSDHSGPSKLLRNSILNSVRSEVLSQLKASRALFQSYLRIRSSATVASSPELIEARNELQDVLRELQVDVAVLVETVNAVEADPYSFGLQIEEVRRRRKLVDDIGDEVLKMHAELVKTVQAAYNKGKAPANGAYLPDPSTFDDDEDYAAEFEQQRQQEIMLDQDETADGLLRTVGNIKQHAHHMNMELEEQGQMLEDVDNIADRVGGKIQSGMRKIGDVIKQNEGKVLTSDCIKLLTGG